MPVDLQKPFYEIRYPELVNDTREIFLDHIDKVGFQKIDVMRDGGVIGVYIKNDPKFDKIRELMAKYPFLDGHYLLFKQAPGRSVLPHLDGDENTPLIGRRILSINIPISGCNENGVTEFYSNPASDFYFEPKYNATIARPGVELKPLIDYRLKDNAMIVYPQVAHGINNIKNNEMRIVVSWSLNLKWTWDDALIYFKDNIIN